MTAVQIKRRCRALPREQLNALALTIFTLKKRKDDPLAEYREKYYWKPLQWVRDFVDVQLPAYLVRAFTAIENGSRKIALQGPHGPGKTVFAALILLWAGSVSGDVKIPTTASAWRQLSKFLWPEIHKWYSHVNWNKIGHEPDLLKLEANFAGGKAFAVACTNSATIEGAHARRVVYIYDEAKAIPPSTWEASEGAFSTPGDHLQVALSTPGSAEGEFYNICSRKKGYESWTVIHITPKDAIRAGRMSLAWAKECRQKWGEKNPAYITRVWGLFAQESSDTTIPLSWVMMAIERWYAWKDAGSVLSGMKVIGADVSRGGADRVAIAHRYGKVLSQIDTYSHNETKDTMVTTGRIINAMGSDGISRVDVIGVGSGCVDRIREQIGDRCIPVNAAQKTKLTDRSGQLGFENIRAAMWWGMRELLNPANNEDICLPDDPELIGDLTCSTYKYSSSGRLLIEPKDAIRKRLGRSTDKGDAAVQAFFDGLTVSEYVYVG